MAENGNINGDNSNAGSELRQRGASAAAQQKPRWRTRWRRGIVHALQGGLEHTEADAGEELLGRDLTKLLFVFTGGPHDEAALEQVVAIARVRSLELVVLRMVQVRALVISGVAISKHVGCFTRLSA